ncbi:hypothetical protein ACLBXI_28830 [Bacillus cereus]
MKQLETQLIEYNNMKNELLQVAKCIDSCKPEERGMYQNIALEYAVCLKRLKKSLQDRIWNL